MITAVVFTHNAEGTVRRCLLSLKFCPEIIVVDDESTDQTEALARQLGAKVFRHKLNDDFSGARNFGLEKARGEWILFVDADEQISKELAFEIKSQISPPVGGLKSQICDGFYLRRQDKFLGCWLHHGETASVKLLRLARRGSGKWQGKVHEIWQVKGKVGQLSAPLRHRRQMSLSQFMERLSWYARVAAKELYQQGKKESILRIFFNPLGKFLQNYFVRLGFLDGFPGLVMAWLMSWHSLLVRLWLQLYWRNNGQEFFTASKQSWE